jgi:DNA-binding protein YbaB
MLSKLQGGANNMGKMAEAMAKRDKLTKMLASIKVTGVSKNGKVTATITGDQKIDAINIDPSLIKFVYENFVANGKPDTMMSRSIMEAIEDAMSKVQQEVMVKMQESNSLGDLMSMLQDYNTGGGM